MDKTKLRLLSLSEESRHPEEEPAFLTAVSTSYNRREPERIKLVEELDSSAKSKAEPSSPQEALKILQHEPDFQSLSSVLRYLLLDRKDKDAFNIATPSPQGAQIIRVLVLEIAPNFWALFKDDPSPGKALHLFLGCLRSVAGVMAIVGWIKALIQESTCEGQGIKNRSDRRLNLSLAVEVLGSVLQGDASAQEIWASTLANNKSPVKRRALSQELVALLGSGRIVSLSAEADRLAKESLSTPQDSHGWMTDGAQYSKWLGRNVASWVLRQVSDEEGKICSELLAKGLRLGYADSLTKTLASTLLWRRKSKPGTLGSLLQQLPHSEQRKILYSFLKSLSDDHLDALGKCENEQSRRVISASAGAIRNIAGQGKEGRAHLVAWLTGLSGAGLGEAVGIRRAVLAVVSQDQESMFDVLDKSLGQFGDQLYIKHSPTLQQEAHAQALILSAGYVHRKCPLKLAMLMRSSVWLNAVSNRLGASSQKARFLGLVVGEAFSGLVDGHDKKLDFHVHETKSEEGAWYQSLAYVVDEPGPLDAILEPQSAKKTSAPDTQRQASTPPRPSPSQPPQQGFIFEGVEGDEDGDIIPYPKPDSDAEDSDQDPTLVRRDRPKAPVYIRDLIRYLRNTENYDHQRLGLTTAPLLIRRKANYGSEVSEHAEELTSLLLGLQDKFDMDDFEDLRCQGMLAVVLAFPEAIGPLLAKTLVDGDYSVHQRASIMTVLGMSARELAGLEPWRHTTSASFPSKRLPEKMERLYVGAAPSHGQRPTPSSLKALPANALERAADDVSAKFLAPLAASAADIVAGPDALKLSTFASRLQQQDKTRPDKDGDTSSILSASSTVTRQFARKPRRAATPNTYSASITSFLLAPLLARFHASLHHASSSSSPRARLLSTNPHLLSHLLKTVALTIHAAGPSAHGLPDFTVQLWHLVSSPALRVRASSDLPVLRSALFVLVVLLELNRHRTRDLCAEMGREVVDAMDWLNKDVLPRIQGDDIEGVGGGEESQARMLALGALVRLRDAVEAYRLLLVGDLIGFA